MQYSYIIHKLKDDLRNNLIHNLITSQLFIGSSAISISKTWVGAWFFWGLYLSLFFFSFFNLSNTYYVGTMCTE